MNKRMMVRGWQVAVRMQEFFVVLYKDEEKNSGYGYCFLVLPHLFGGIVMFDAPFVC